MAVIPTATISTKNDNYDHSLAPGFIEFSGKQFVFEGSSWPFQQNSYDTLLLDPDIINIRDIASCVPVDHFVCPTLTDTNLTIDGADDLDGMGNNVADATFTLQSGVSLTLQTTCTDTACNSGDGIRIFNNITASGASLGDLTITSTRSVSLETATISGFNAINITADNNIYLR